MSECPVKPAQNFAILTSGIKKQGVIELPDNTSEIGAASGEVLGMHYVVPESLAPLVDDSIDEFIKDFLRFGVGDIVYYDGSKAFKICTDTETYIAVKIEDVICVLESENK